MAFETCSPQTAGIVQQKIMSATKILIVEDNELNRDMLQRRLIRRGYDVILAVDGAQGLAAARAQRPDLILMDLRLPDMNGREVTRRLREDEPTARLPIIALTAHAMDADKAQALAAGCDDFDTKPIDMPRLLAKIEGLLKCRGSTGCCADDRPTS